MATVDLTEQSFAQTLVDNDTVFVDFWAPWCGAAASITSIPTLMAFKDKTLVFSQPGALNATGLEEVIQAVKTLDMNKFPANAAPQHL